MVHTIVALSVDWKFCPSWAQGELSSLLEPGHIVYLRLWYANVFDEVCLSMVVSYCSSHLFEYAVTHQYLNV